MAPVVSPSAAATLKPRSLPSATRLHCPADCCGSASTTTVRPRRDRPAARFMVRVVFPTPPLLLANAKTVMPVDLGLRRVRKAVEAARILHRRRTICPRVLIQIKGHVDVGAAKTHVRIDFRRLGQLRGHVEEGARRVVVGEFEASLQPCRRGLFLPFMFCRAHATLQPINDSYQACSSRACSSSSSSNCWKKPALSASPLRRQVIVASRYNDTISCSMRILCAISSFKPPPTLAGRSCEALGATPSVSMRYTMRSACFITPTATTRQSRLASVRFQVSHSAAWDMYCCTALSS